MPGNKRSRKPSLPPAKLMTELARRGPHRVLSGDLGIVGAQGRVLAPERGSKRPAVAFAHGWLAGTGRYRDLLQHLASWGIVVGVAEGQRGPLASDVALAADLRSVLSVVSRVPLGSGEISVDPEAIGVIGHGLGASAAVLAASESTLLGQPQPALRGVVALFPAPTTGTLLPAARTATAPAMVVAGPGEIDTVDGNALPLAQAYGGDVVLRTIPGAYSRGLLERRSPKSLLGINGADKLTHTAVRAMCTGFLLHTLTGDPQYQAFGDPQALLGKVTNVDPGNPPEQPLDAVSRLFGAKPRRRHPVARLVAARATQSTGGAGSR